MDVTVLNKKKGVVKAKLTKMSAYLENYELNAQSAIELTVKLNNLKALRLEVKELQLDYCAIVTEDPEKALENIEERLDQIEVRILFLLSTIDNKNNEKHSESGNCPAATSEKNKYCTTKLPDIPLPVFSGDYSQFHNFKMQFTNLIVRNETLNDTQRLFYLQSALKGETRNLITNDDTLDSLLAALDERYNNKRLVVESIIQRFINYREITTESAKELRALTDSIKKNLRSLKLLNYIQNELSDIMLINILTPKLDSETRKQYELSLKSREVPKLEEFLSFLETRSIVLESLERNIPSKITKSFSSQHTMNKNKNVTSTTSRENDRKCLVCRLGFHSLFKCEKFLAMDVSERYNFIKGNKLCVRCLNKHNISQCHSKYLCRHCGKSHSSFLCRSNESALLTQDSPPSVGANSITQQNIDAETRSPTNTTVQSFSTHIRGKKMVLLCTAEVFIEDVYGSKHKLRVILDSASTSSFLTQSTADLLQLKKHKTNISVSGINGINNSVHSWVSSRVSDSKGEFNQSMDFFVVPNISTSLTPSARLDISDLKLPEFIKLADENFYIPGKIQALIGNEYFFEILKTNKFRSWDNKLILQDSVFGYLISGTLPTYEPQNVCFLSNQLECLDKTVKQFFELELLPVTSKPILSDEEILAEKHFVQTHKRQSDGRYIVSLPVKEDGLSKLSNTFSLAKKRLDSTWNRLERDPVMKDLYVKFMSEYESLGHMVESTSTNYNDTLSGNFSNYFMPHHGVFRPEKSSSKLRVVFDGSAKGNTGTSLNDVLLKGPILQEDLFSILLKLRIQKYVIISDIKMMYRQISVNKSQQNLQQILWKWGKDEPVRIYNLTTVTYGTACAPYLATRTLKQLSVDERETFPEAASVLATDTYMDDILTGESSIDRAKLLQTQLINLLAKGQFELHKWSSNAPELLDNIPEQQREYSFNEPSNARVVKTLGLLWNPKLDFFSYRVSVSRETLYTKRDVLSQIARIFDPLGLIGPVIAKMKILLQRLWLKKLSWTDHIGEPEATEWHLIITSLPAVQELKIPRFVLQDNVISVFLEGFADASTVGFGACVYIKTISQHGKITISLMCSRSRVAPMKPLTVPRLELSACLLLSKLVTKTLSAIKIDLDEINLYTDSTIALAWIQTPPHKLKTYVSHRVNEIQLLTENFTWNHVPSTSNPADVLSRGATPEELISNELWFKGPSFLYSYLRQPDYWERPDETVTDYISEIKDKQLDCSTCLLLTKLSDLPILKNISSYTKLLRIIAYCFRFIFNCKNKGERISGALTSSELNRALIGIVKNVQQVAFSNEIHNLTQGKPLASNSKLLSLCPFMDKNGLLRVGGRLNYSHLPIEQKHPLLLPNSHEFTNLVITYYHISYLHAGTQQLLYLLRLKFWIIGGRNLIRKVIYHCLTCRKVSSKTSFQRMADLPAARVTQARPFSRVGIDYAGPFQYKERGGRGKKVFKCYVCIFICFVVKATHIEIANSLETNSFLAALKRFIARRGRPLEIYCDRGTNFVGANNELRKTLKATFASDNAENLEGYMAKEGIKFNFNPPASPHMGGLWEAGVKGVKYHMKRIIGNTIFTYEQLLTLMAQIEAVMNSRPLCQQSNDPNDLASLTPGHFLIGCPLVSIPEPDLTDVPMNRLTQFQTIQKLVQSFWKRWTNEYLTSLQSRIKWKVEGPNLTRGQLVLVKNDSLPVLKWKLARIIEVHPSKDKRVRVVTIQCENGCYKRPITQLAPLPYQD